MHIQNSYVRNIYKILTLLKKKSEVCLSLANDDKCKTIEDKLSAFCDKSRHTASSENYFIDAKPRSDLNCMIRHIAILQNHNFWK